MQVLTFKLDNFIYILKMLKKKIPPQESHKRGISPIFKTEIQALNHYTKTYIY